MMSQKVIEVPRIIKRITTIITAVGDAPIDSHKYLLIQLKGTGFDLKLDKDYFKRRQPKVGETVTIKVSSCDLGLNLFDYILLVKGHGEAICINHRDLITQ
ncbi:MAG: hypothetical protein ABIE68_02935 [bacterium]